MANSLSCVRYLDAVFWLATIAIGDKYYTLFTGRVQIFTEHPEKGWKLLGTVIDGENINDWSWRSVALSSDGTAIAVGATGTDSSSWLYANVLIRHEH